MIGPVRQLILILASLLASQCLETQCLEAGDVPDHVREFLENYCLDCHSGRRPKAKLDLADFPTVESMAASPKTWEKVSARMREGDMPPEDEEQPPVKARASVIEWLDASLLSSACADGVSPGPPLIRRLNQGEYGATMRDLLGVHFNAADTLPADGAGGSGFDNSAESLFISPVHLEKYLDAATRALDYAVKDPRASRLLITDRPGKGKSPQDAARRVFDNFLPRAFRRPLRPQELEDYLSLFRKARERGDSYEEAIVFALRAALISPYFLLRLETGEPGDSSEPLDGFELASRLSYFLWGTLPDQELLRLAKEGRLHDEKTLEQQVTRMLRDGRAIGFATSFVEQWLGTRELGRGIKPDRSISRHYDDDLEAVFKYEPVLFFQEILSKDLSLLNLIDAKFSYMNNELARHYRLKIAGLREHPRRVDLPEGSHRGGVLGMAAVLAVSSYPHRTSPVLRGKWILETLLGTPPPPPPPNVPELEEPGEKAAAATVRERLLRHREKPACATCHDRIDPLGFGLENYDMLGRWRTKDSGRPIDARGKLPDGTVFDGPAELKALLMKRKNEFVRHLTSAMLGYALSRGLTFEDYCVVDSIVEKLVRDDYSSHRLVLEIVRSVPFRFKAIAAKREASAEAGE